MFGHVNKKLTAYLHGELSGAEVQRVDAHLSRCESCRKVSDDVKFAARLAGFLSVKEAPPFLLNSIAVAEQPGVSRRGMWFAFGFALATIVVAVALRMWPQPLPPLGEISKWEVNAADGSTSKLREGQWLVTSGNTDTTITAQDVGEVRVEPNSKIRLIESQRREQRMELERGTLHAQVWAPPRLFFVNTPSATAIDLGCIYTLRVDDDGAGLLYVKIGLVELNSDGRESTVPANAFAKTRKNEGPGTPYSRDASSTLREALDVIDFSKDGSAKSGALNTVIQEAKSSDLISLWHLLSRVDVSVRDRVYERMIALATPPDGITAAGIHDLNPEMMRNWKSHLGLVW